MFTTSLKTIKATKKEHQCAYCGRTIPIGRGAYSWFFAEKYDKQHPYACVPCVKRGMPELTQDDGVINYTTIDVVLEEGLGGMRCPKCNNDKVLSAFWEPSDNTQLVVKCAGCGHVYKYNYGF